MKKPIEWRIGCAGFHYKEWKNIFYPPLLLQKHWFSYYAKHFNTLEVNSTFYQFPRLGALQNWYVESPDDFTFSLKVPRLITHYKKFREATGLLDDFYNTVHKGLRDKLGAVLFQLPPQFQYTEERLQLLTNSVQKGFTNVIEFRHASWWQQPVYDELGKQKISFCGSSHPSLADEVIINTGIVYYRFHGVPDLFHSLYDNKYIQEKADSIKAAKKVTTAYIYFNNTAGPAALENARWLQHYPGLKGA